MQSDDLKKVKGFVDNLNIVVDKYPSGETHFWKGKYGDTLAIVDVFETHRNVVFTASGKRCLADASKQSAD